MQRVAENLTYGERPDRRTPKTFPWGKVAAEG